MKKKQEVLNKKSIIERFSLMFVLLAILIMSVAHAQISDIELKVTGELDATVQEGVFISDISASTSGAINESVKYYKGTTLSTNVELSSLASSSVTYTISLYNNSAQKQYFKGVSYAKEAYDNTNITYELNGLTPYITTIEPKASLPFTITFKYAEGITPSTSQVLNSMLNFVFESKMIEFKVADISYSAQEGATWEQFINSEYNSYGFKIENEKVCSTEGKVIVVEGVDIKQKDVISESLAYNIAPVIMLDKEIIKLEISGISGSTATEILTATIENVTEEQLTWTIETADSGITLSGTGTTRTLTVSKEIENAIIKVSYGDYNAICNITVHKKISKVIDINGNDVNGKILSTTETTDVWDAEGKKLVIPAGYMVRVDDSTNNSQNVRTGLVIEDEKKNQFVWVPVEDINDMVMCQTCGDAGSLNQETLQCTTCETNTKLAGKLYASKTSHYNFNSSLTGQTYSSDSELREPANLSTTYDNISNLLTWNSTLYQETFDAMVESVAKYKGFYVGRYELSIKENVAQSIAEETSAYVNTTISNKWFELYEKSKTYASYNSNAGVVSEMIWGCQYDAMMIWMENNNIAVISDAPIDTARGIVASHNDTRITGVQNSNDILNNIHDLLGNSLEWTQEAYGDGYRVYRGGAYNIVSSPSVRFYDGSPTGVSKLLGTRLSLYIKVPELTLDKQEINLTIESGSTATDTLTATLKNATGDLSWESSDTTVAEIIGTGNTRTITLKKAGTATITVSYGSVSATCTVNVTEKIVSLITFTVNGSEYKAEEGMTLLEFVYSKYNTGGFVAYEFIWNGVATGTYIILTEDRGETLSKMEFKYTLGYMEAMKRLNSGAPPSELMEGVIISDGTDYSTFQGSNITASLGDNVMERR